VLKIGFVVNPIAGMGGRIGLKGTDNVLSKALAMGATPVSPKKAVEFLKRLKELGLIERISLLTCPAVMGENEVKSAGLKAEILSISIGAETSACDTRRAVNLMHDENVDLIVFVGGDGTARDIFDALEGRTNIAVLGVPSGVKMYSGIFAASINDAADMVQSFLDGETQIADFEVVDADEEAIRSNRFSTKLYGFLKGPFVPMHVLGSKQISPETLDEHENQMAVARFVFEEMKPEATYILGPGTTTKCVADLLGFEKTLLGVDIYQGGKIIKDANEQKILREVKDWNNTWIVLSPVGRQGVLLGRGNQEISSEVVRRVGKNHIVVVATRGKIQGIEGNVLRVETGDAQVDGMLRGYIRVAIDYREWRLMQVL
jgi:predicted polyphosphate/ATP-dependent NAD kinase